MELLKAISKILNNSHDKYNNFPKSYAPEGIISILRDQVRAKLEYETINEFGVKKLHQ